MKSFWVLGLACLSLASLSSTAEARTRRVQPPSEHRTLAAEPSPSYGSGGTHFWLGVASASDITNSITPALSFMIGFSDKLALQTYAMIDSSSPFVFAVGGTLKYSLLGDNTKGFHLGGGLGLGTIGRTKITIDPATGLPNTSSTVFFVNIAGMLGFHFDIVDRVQLAIDAGPSVAISDGNTQFRLRSLSALVGLSVLYHL